MWMLGIDPCLGSLDEQPVHLTVEPSLQPSANTLTQGNPDNIEATAHVRGSVEVMSFDSPITSLRWGFLTSQ